jgi:hypothetical protein
VLIDDGDGDYDGVDDGDDEAFFQGATNITIHLLARYFDISQTMLFRI